MINVIQRTDPGKFEHYVCTVRNGGPLADHLRESGVPVFPLVRNGKRPRLQVPHLLQRIRAIRPAIVHSRNWGAIEAVFAASIVRGCGVIHSEHGLEAQTEPFRRRVIRRGAFELSDQVFTVSNQLREFHSSASGFPSSRITVIHNGVDTDRFRPRPEHRAELRHRFGIHPEEFCFGLVARLDQVKNIPLLLSALKRFAVHGQRWRLLIAGDGPEYDTLHTMVETSDVLRLGVGMLGELRDVRDFLNAVDAFVLPSLFEGTSNSLLEAMASGLPVIASAVGGNTELVGPESGLLFPPQDVDALSQCLATLQSNVDLRMRLAEGARSTVERHFSITAMVSSYERLYEGVASGRSALPSALYGDA
jgi:sugar transferase (PEP-CTERM/EpsH1 system associated)